MQSSSSSSYTSSPSTQTTVASPMSTKLSSTLFNASSPSAQTTLTPSMMPKQSSTFFNSASNIHWSVSYTSSSSMQTILTPLPCRLNNHSHSSFCLYLYLYTDHSTSSMPTKQSSTLSILHLHTTLKSTMRSSTLFNSALNIQRSASYTSSPSMKLLLLLPC